MSKPSRRPNREEIKAQRKKKVTVHRLINRNQT